MNELTLEEKREAIFRENYFGPFSKEQKREMVDRMMPAEVEYYYKARNIGTIKPTCPIT